MTIKCITFQLQMFTILRMFLFIPEKKNFLKNLKDIPNRVVNLKITVTKAKSKSQTRN
jgi:hypothetical protein